jgi:ribosomal protein S19
MIIEHKCKDDPEAQGRIPIKGDQRFTLIFPLENGDELKVHMGKESMNHFEIFIAQMMVDDQAERESNI